MMSQLATIAKFRPVLSATKILHIIKLCKAEASKESLEIVADLARFEWQIKNDAVKPAYVTQPRESLSSALGFEEAVDKYAQTFEVEPSTLYQIWLTEPETLTVAQISKVREYRYHNNKMTDDEEKAFEHEVLGL